MRVVLSFSRNAVTVSRPTGLDLALEFLSSRKRSALRFRVNASSRPHEFLTHAYSLYTRGSLS